jgi:hypothetical protein
MTNLYDFLFPKSPYYGHITPQNLIFNANLQEFAQKVNYISALETSGKISPQEAFQELEILWEELQSSKILL